MRRIAIFVVFVAAIVTGYALGFYAQPAAAPGQGMKMNKTMGGMTATDAPVIPPVTGYAKGKRILFIHTETSDRKIAKLLTDMMGGSPVLLVPSISPFSIASSTLSSDFKKRAEGGSFHVTKAILLKGE